MADAADMLTTCVMSAGLITKLRDLCPFPYGLFFHPLESSQMRLMIITAEHLVVLPPPADLVPFPELPP